MRIRSCSSGSLKGGGGEEGRIKGAGLGSKSLGVLNMRGDRAGDPPRGVKNNVVAGERATLIASVTVVTCRGAIGSRVINSTSSDSRRCGSVSDLCGNEWAGDAGADIGCVASSSDSGGCVGEGGGVKSADSGSGSGVRDGGGVELGVGVVSKVRSGPSRPAVGALSSRCTSAQTSAGGAAVRVSSPAFPGGRVMISGMAASSSWAGATVGVVGGIDSVPVGCVDPLAETEDSSAGSAKIGLVASNTSPPWNAELRRRLAALRSCASCPS